MDMRRISEKKKISTESYVCWIVLPTILYYDLMFNKINFKDFNFNIALVNFIFAIITLNRVVNL